MLCYGHTREVSEGSREGHEAGGFTIVQEELTAPSRGDNVLRVIRLVRKEKARLTQREAAEMAGISVSTWKHVEAGLTEPSDDIIANMCYTVGVQPSYLRKIGCPHIASGVEERLEAMGSKLPANHDGMAAIEAHLWQTPHLSSADKTALIAFSRTMKEIEEMDVIPPEWVMTAANMAKLQRHHHA